MSLFGSGSNGSSLLNKRKMSGLSLNRGSFKSRMSFNEIAEISTGSATPITMASYTMGQHLGSGFQGSVYKAVRKSDNKHFVVKVLTANEENGLAMARNEVSILQKIVGQEHLAQIVESCEEGFMQKVYIFMEDAGSLSLEALMKEHKQGLPLESCVDLFRQLCTAVATLHELKICHRDLKPDNILLKPDASRPSGYYLTVVDFNVAVDMVLTPVITGATGLKSWSAPETRTSVAGYEEKCDVFSLGCLL
jgi:serine/threonine protein kinase